jgi:hypothetical protein
MGLLDDAIREHLELKRRHGADPDDVARQENEALGATRRAEFARPEGGEPGEAEAEAGEPAAPPPEVEAAEPAAPPPGVEAAEPAAPPPEAAEPVAPPADVVADEPEPTPAEPVAEADAPIEAGDEREPFDIEAVEAAPGAAEPPTEAVEPWLEAPDEVPADEALDHPRTEEPDPGEDVLEETPDFLQETPEHDRLWFEQRPPRDFDWDK